MANQGGFSTQYFGGLLLFALAGVVRADALPFDQAVETYHDSESGVTVFALRLEQPFLAGEFERSNYLRLKPLDKNAWLVYPRETRFEQKHAEFYGRLRRTDADANVAVLNLSYEVVSENLDGSRKVDVREAQIEIPIPAQDGGSDRLYKDWARRQNAHFAELLRYYPENSFLEYVLLQSKARYGVDPPPLPGATPSAGENDLSLYHTFGGGLAVQQSLQREVLGRGARSDDLTVHISRLTPPDLRSLDYETRLERQREDGREPRPNEATRLIPADQYFLQFQSMGAVNELMTLSEQWGANLLRMFQVSARDHHLKEKYQDQLGLWHDDLDQLFADEAIAEFAVTGSDFFIAEGTDVTLLLRLRRPAAVRAVLDARLSEAQQRWPEIAQREFNYRGRQVAARYTPDRTVSSFVVFLDDYAVVSNSHRAIRRVIDTALQQTESLYDQLDYQYVTTLFPPEASGDASYLYCSEAFLKRLASPQFKIAEKRRRQAFTNLVMLNNASLFYRLEHGRSPDTLSDLVDGDFVDLSRIVDPAGGAYAFDAAKDTATSSVYNRIKYLTPIMELDVLNVSEQERREYEEYKRRYEAVWRPYFDPIALRITARANSIKLETLVLPFANSGAYVALQQMVDAQPQPFECGQTAASAVASFAVVPGRQRIGEFLRRVPGVSQTLEADPTLTDLSWLGDRISLHFCDDDTILEIDPLRLKPLHGFFPASIEQQGLVATAVTATNLPVCLTVAVDDEAKAKRFLEQLASKVFLQSEPGADFAPQLDAYRLPDYAGREIYVFSVQFYAAKLRLYLALVDGRLAAATDRDALRQLIDASQQPAAHSDAAHAWFRIRFSAMEELKKDLHIYWAEKARQAAHRNVMPLYILTTLYDTSVEQANAIADAKYGVTYFCPGGGRYVYDAGRDQIASTVFGNRRNARQQVALDDNSPFARFFNSLDEISVTVRFLEDGLLGTAEIKRHSPE